MTRWIWLAGWRMHGLILTGHQVNYCPSGLVSWINASLYLMTCSTGGPWTWREATADDELQAVPQCASSDPWPRRPAPATGFSAPSTTSEHVHIY